MNGDPIAQGDNAISMDMDSNGARNHQNGSAVNTQQHSRISFRDTLAKNNPNMVFSSYSNPVWNVNDEDYCTSNDNEHDSHGEEDPRCPRIHLTKEQKHQFRQP